MLSSLLLLPSSPDPTLSLEEAKGWVVAGVRGSGSRKEHNVTWTPGAWAAGITRQKRMSRLQASAAPEPLSAHCTRGAPGARRPGSRVCCDAPPRVTAAPWQLTCKIVDPEVNGGLRYKGWTHHRERVLERLGGWSLIAQGPDFATFSIPQVGGSPSRARDSPAAGGGVCPDCLIA